VPLASTSHPVNAETAGAAAVSLEHVSRIFGRFAALRDVTADFAVGRMCVILGENGAGKSTLLRVIAGLLRPSAGSVTIFGSSDRDQARADMGYMAHATLLYDEMTALENLEYFVRLYGTPDRARCEQVIEQVGLDARLMRHVGQYSQGMRQRTALARALLHRPRLLLLDEPFSNLDPGSSAAMAELLGRLRDEGKTVLVVTHQVAHLAGIADESLWMSGGGIVVRTPGVGAAERLMAATPRSRVL
jgi:heme ABC exporter ATP-binding subunit CcmA